MITSLAMVFAIMTSYTRARAESLIPKCKVGFMERPERIVLFMIGAFTNRMAAVMWVILVLSVFTVADRIYSRIASCANAEQQVIAEARTRRCPLRVLGTRSTGPTSARPGIRPDGDRDPGVRLAHAARLAGRSRWPRATGPIGWITRQC